MAVPRSSPDGLVLSTKVARDSTRTSIILSRSINIVVNGKTIGYIQSFHPTEGRQTTKTWELGNEDIVEIVPGGMTEDSSIIIQRALLYQSRMLEVFDSKNGEQMNDLQPYPVSVMDYNYPFDIHVLLHRLQSKEPKSEVDIFEMEAYIGCWFTKIDYEVKATDADLKIIENATVQYTYKRGTSLLKRQ